MQVGSCTHHSHSLKLHNLASAEKILYYSERMIRGFFVNLALGGGYLGDCGQKLARRH